MASPYPLSLSMDSILRPLINKTIHPFSPPRLSALRPSAFLDAAGTSNLDTLNNFQFTHQFTHGCLSIRQMEIHELDSTAQLLADSFAQSMSMPEQYARLLVFLVRQYVLERRLLVPHTATLVGFYRATEEGGGGEARLACTAEISFDAVGANAAPPTPVPPRECPYICNMTVEKSLRRRGIGWQILKACEELISQMNTSRKVYLHCRLVDKGPFSMYTKAGYKVVNTDSVFIWLYLQRRKYLMYKELPILDDARSDTSNSNLDDARSDTSNSNFNVTRDTTMVMREELST